MRKSLGKGGRGVGQRMTLSVKERKRGLSVALGRRVCELCPFHPPLHVGVDLTAAQPARLSLPTIGRVYAANTPANGKPRFPAPFSTGRMS